MIKPPPRLQPHVVYVAPNPVLARLERLHDRVLGCVKVFGRMFIFGTIAAADVSTDQADAQMDPAVADFQAVLATLLAWGHFINEFKMRASYFIHGYFPVDLG